MSNICVANTPLSKILDNVSERVKEFHQKGEIHFPLDYSPSNALKSAWIIIQGLQDKDKKSALEVCSRESIANSLLSMVIQGLNPDKKQGHFIIYGNTLSFQRSYFGTMAVCKQVTGAKDIFAEVVYEGDEFEYEIKYGRKIVTKHVQKLINIDKKKIVAAYCTIITGEDSEFSDIMTFDEIKQAWKMSRTGGCKDGKIVSNSVHDNFTAEMSKRTIINRTCKTHINSSNDNNLIIRHFNKQDVDMVDVEVEAEITENANTIVLEDVLDLDSKRVKDQAGF